MPGGKTKFKSDWLQTVDCNKQKLSQWCRKGKDDYHAYCRFCDTEVKCDNSGLPQVAQHARRGKHKEAMKFLLDNKQMKLMPVAPSTSTSKEDGKKEVVAFSYEDACLAAQIYWLAKVSVSNYSLRSTDHIGDTFRAMFPDSKIAADFHLSRTSASYIIGEGMGPHLKEVIVEDLKKSGLPYAIHFDETSTAQVKKQMDLTLRFWSPTHDKVWVAFYTSLFFGHAEGHRVAAQIFKQLQEDKMPLDKLLTLVRDGPNVNKTICRELQQKIIEEHPKFKGFVDLGSCVLHIVHNAFGKGLKNYGKEVDQLCLDVHALFKYSAARREDYQHLQQELDIDLMNFQQHTSVRWLSLGPAIKRLLNQWDCILEFVAQLAKEGNKNSPQSSNFRRVCSMLLHDNKKTTKVQLDFLHACVPLFEAFLTDFQKCGPTIHYLYDSMCETFLKLLRRFMKPEALKGLWGVELTRLKIEDRNLQVTDKEMDIGDSTRSALAALKSEQQKAPLLGMRAFFVSAAVHLQSKLPFDNKFLKDLGCINPKKRERKSTVSSIQNLAKTLQPDLDVNVVLDEWKLFQMDKDVPAYDVRLEIEDYWNSVFSLKTFDGSVRYKLLPLVIKSGLVLAQTNAESERSLSINARVVTKDRASLGETTIVGLRSVKEGVRFYDPTNSKPESMVVTKELKRSVRGAYSSYMARKEQEHLQEEAIKEKRQSELEAEEKAKKDEERLKKKRKHLSATDTDLRNEEEEIKGEIEAANQLIDEATKKLQDALSTGGSMKLNKQTVNVATMMLTTAKEKHAELLKKMEIVHDKQRKLQTETQKLLDKVMPSTDQPEETKKKKSKHTK